MDFDHPFADLKCEVNDSLLSCDWSVDPRSILAHRHALIAQDCGFIMHATMHVRGDVTRCPRCMNYCCSNPAAAPIYFALNCLHFVSN
jgi:hypothetical protein